MLLSKVITCFRSVGFAGVVPQSLSSAAILKHLECTSPQPYSHIGGNSSLCSLAQLTAEGETAQPPLKQQWGTGMAHLAQYVAIL